MPAKRLAAVYGTSVAPILIKPAFAERAELDDALGFSAVAGERLADARTGKNGRHVLVGTLRQAVFGRLARYEDVNDAERLRHDPAMPLNPRRESGVGMRRVGQPDRPLRDAMADRRKEPVGSRRSFRTLDRPRSCSPSAAKRRALHGFERQSDPWRAGDGRLERTLRMHLLSLAVRVHPVRRSGALRTASSQRSQRRWLGRRIEAGRGALSRQSLTPLFPRRRRLRQSRRLRIP